MTLTADDRVEEIRNSIEEHLRRTRLALPAGVVPAPASPASRHVNNDETGPGGAWGEEPVQTYLSLVGLILDVASDHLAGLMDLLSRPLLRFAPAALARASIECSAQMYWLLEPAQTLRERVARGLDEQLRSAGEMKRTLGRLGDDHGVTLEELERRLSLRRLQLCVPSKAKRPTATEMAGVVLAKHVSAEGGGEGIYKYLSALTHGTLYASLQRHKTTEVESGSKYTKLMEPHMGVQAVETMGFTSVMAHAEAVDRVLVYLGADYEGWREWYRQVGEELTPRH